MNVIMEIRKQVRLSQWSEMVREREKSRLSIRDFCVEKAFSTKTYGNLCYEVTFVNTAKLPKVQR